MHLTPRSTTAILKMYCVCQAILTGLDKLSLGYTQLKKDVAKLTDRVMCFEWDEMYRRNHSDVLFDPCLVFFLRLAVTSSET